MPEPRIPLRPSTVLPEKCTYSRERTGWRDRKWKGGIWSSREEGGGSWLCRGQRMRGGSWVEEVRRGGGKFWRGEGRGRGDIGKEIEKD